MLTLHGSPITVLRQLARYVLVTGSYARRDVVSPLLRGRRPTPAIVVRRLRALVAYARLAPRLVVEGAKGRSTVSRITSPA